MPAKKHDFTGTEIKAGLLVLVSLAVMGIFLAAITGMRPPEETNTFYATFTSTSGLNRSADVRFGGTKVGKVVDIALDPGDQSRLRVEAQVRKDVPVNKMSRAYITQATLTSEMHLEITTGEKEAPLLESGAVIEEGAGGLFGQAEGLAEDVGKTIKMVNELLGVEKAKEKEARGEGEMVTVPDLFQNLDDVLKKGQGLVGDVRDVVAERKGDVEGIMKKVQEVEDSATKLLADVNDVLAENRESISGTFSGVDKIIEDAQPIVERVANLSGKLEELADSLQGTLDNAQSLTDHAGGIMADNRPAIEEIVLDLRETVRNLKTFSRTMAEQPQAVIRGKNPEGRK